MSTYKQQNSNNWKKSQPINTDSDGFTMVKSKRNFKDEPTLSPPPNSQNQQNNATHWNRRRNTEENNSYSSRSSYHTDTRQHYHQQPNRSHNTTPKNISPSSNKPKPKKLSYEEQFPSIPTTTIPTPIIHTNIPNTNSLNFKTAIDKPSVTIPISSTKDNKTPVEEKETFDLSLYVKIQERRQKEYDLIYGEGSFVSDRLNYERYPSDNESDDNDEDEELEDMDHEDELYDY